MDLTVRRAGLGLAVVLLAACSMPPAPSLPATLPPDPDLVVATDSDGPFELTLGIGGMQYAEREPIEAWGRVIYAGPEPAVQIAVSGGGLVTFTGRQLDGRLRVGGISPMSCQQLVIDRGVPIDEPIDKGATWPETDPDAAFYQAWTRDPVYWLPKGTWEISAIADFALGDCSGPRRRLSAQLTIEIR